MIRMVVDMKTKELLPLELLHTIIASIIAYVSVPMAYLYRAGAPCTV